MPETKKLAIQGGEPAFAEPLHVGRPNIGDFNLFVAHAKDIFERAWLTNNGPLVEKLENEIATYHQVQNCVATCNGTVALELAVRALGFQGEVILPSFTFIATAHALQWQEITPIFADIDRDSHLVDPKAVERMITPRTTGIIGVHTWGRISNTSALKEIAEKHGLDLIFDAAHAFGCSDGHKMVGNFGRCEVLSMHATKFFNTFEGGAILTNEDELAKKLRLMRNFGFAGNDNVIHSGTNGKMTEICAAMGLVNFEKIEEIIYRNRENYEAYRSEIASIPKLKLFELDKNCQNNFQYIVVQIKGEAAEYRDFIIRGLHAEGILARRYFWPGCHNMTPYRQLQPHAHLLLKNTIEVSEQIVVLPTGQAVDLTKVKTICDILKRLVVKADNMKHSHKES